MHKENIVEVFAKAIVPIICIISIVVIEITAIQKNINGTALAVAIAAIAGLGGYTLPDILKIFKKQREDK